jgi:N-acetylmuramoyl-L-alanine amidase
MLLATLFYFGLYGYAKIIKKIDIKKENNYYMYKQINKPGILIEAGFISNPNDNYLLRDNDYQNKLINVIVKGIENYF